MQSTLYEPEEWESVTVTRFALGILPAARYVGVVTAGGFLIYDRLSNRWRNPITRADGLPEGNIESISQGIDGTFIVRTRRSAVSIEPSRGVVRTDYMQQVPSPPVQPLPSNLYTDPDYHYLGEGRLTGPAGITVDILDAKTDDQGGMWLATWGLGAGRADLRTLQLDMKPNGLWSSDVRALVINAGRIVAGGFGDFRSKGGISEWNIGADRWTYILAPETPGLLSDRVAGLVQEDRNLWVAVEGGVARRTAGGRWRSWTESNGLPDGRTTAIAAGSGAVWLGTLRGAVAIAGDSIATLPLYRDEVVRDIATGAGGVWWATDSGAYLYRGKWPTGALMRIDHPQKQLEGQIDAVGTFGEEVWWAGYRGIVAYNSGNGTWLDVPAAGPFFPGEITDIALDETNVWITTTQGVWRLIRSREEWYRYDEVDGLLDRRVWCVAIDGQVAWFGTAEGITRFDWRMRRRAP